MGKRWKVYRKKDERHRSKPDLDALEEEYIRRAEEMEKELFADEDFVDYEPTDEQERESYARLIQRLKDDGIYCEDDDVERKHAAGMENLRKAAGGRRKMYFAKAGKVAGVAILCCACVFAASMTSEANRSYFVKGVRYLVGDDTRIAVDNDENNETINTSEYEAIEEIENKLGVDMPEFFYRPQKFEFISYEVDVQTAVAHMEYQYEGKVIAYYIDAQDRNTASNIKSMHGNKQKIIITNDDGMKVSIEKIQDSNDEEPSYNAQWSIGQVLFHLSGKIELYELEKIIKYMKI